MQIQKGIVKKASEAVTKTDKNIFFLDVQLPDSAAILKVSGFGSLKDKNEVTIKMGDLVDFEYTTSGDYNNIQGEVIIVGQENEQEKVVEETVGDSSHPNPTVADYNKSKSDDIHFQVCLKIAADVLKMKDSVPSAEQIVNYAKDLVKAAWGN